MIHTDQFERRHDWVNARPFAAHVRRLLAETGLGWAEFACHAQLPPRLIRRLAEGPTPRKLCAPHARRLWRIQLTDLREALGTPITADAARQLAGRLAEWGIGAEAIGAALGGDLGLARSLIGGARGTLLLRQELGLRALAGANGLRRTAPGGEADVDELLVA